MVYKTLASQDAPKSSVGKCKEGQTVSTHPKPSWRIVMSIRVSEVAGNHETCLTF